jgi:LPPG:FO 2-phospho-L-lactate transferase
VSPLIGGKTVKGPADRVMSSLGLGTGNHAVVDSYRGLIDRLVIDNTDSADAASLRDVEVVVTDTLITDPKQATRLARELVEG